LLELRNFKAHSPGGNISLAWTPDGTRLFSAGDSSDSSIREWDSSTWKQIGGPWNGHLQKIYAISLNSSGTLLASASEDHRVRLWRLSDRRTIDSFMHTLPVSSVTFSADDRHILSSSGGAVSEWPLSKNSMPKDVPRDVPRDVPNLVEQVTDQVIMFIYAHFRHLNIFLTPRLEPTLILRHVPTFASCNRT
jgi:WD40 repeat protein